MRFTIYITIILLLLSSCNKEGEKTTRKVSVLPFHHIELNGAFDLILTEGEELSVSVKGYENSIDKVFFNSLEDTLYVTNDRKFKWVTPRKNKIEIHVTSPPLKRVKADGGSYVTTTNPITTDEFGLILTGKSAEAHLTLNCGVFYFWNNFPTGGKLKLSGTTDVLKLWNTALMSVDAEDLISNSAIVENYSKGDCIVSVQEKLEYRIEGSGNIQVYGAPSVLVNNGINSTGKLTIH
jgi:hypothetical protein